MKTKTCILLAVLSALLIPLLSAVASAEYTVSAEQPDGPVYSGGADGTLSFWELPLYFKLITVGCVLSALLLGLPKIIPLLFTVIKTAKRNEDEK